MAWIEIERLSDGPAGRLVTRVAKILGIRIGHAPTERMAPCPETPNCVSTRATSKPHAIAPITYRGSFHDAKARLLAVIDALPRTKMIVDDGAYLHVEFRTAVFRFVDDVEFEFDDKYKVIHFRSASRLGRDDLGVNRRRMEQVRATFVEAP